MIKNNIPSEGIATMICVSGQYKYALLQTNSEGKNKWIRTKYKGNNKNEIIDIERY